MGELGDILRESAPNYGDKVKFQLMLGVYRYNNRLMRKIGIMANIYGQQIACNLDDGDSLSCLVTKFRRALEVTPRRIQ